VSFSDESERSPDELRFHDVAAVDDLDDGEGTIVFANYKKFALFRIDGEFHCIQNHCPHAGGFLGNGRLRGTEVLCPRHAWRFDVRDGSCARKPRYCVDVYETRVVDGRVQIGLPDSPEPW
jgi:nitrite reductase/ring-hydroxylating ferredoxin subunit